LAPRLLVETHLSDAIFWRINTFMIRLIGQQLIIIGQLMSVSTKCHSAKCFMTKKRQIFSSWTDY